MPAKNFSILISVLIFTLPLSIPLSALANEDASICVLEKFETQTSPAPWGGSEFWQKYDRDFQEVLHGAIRERLPYFRRAESENIPYIRLLKKAGLKLEPEVVVPTLESVFQVYKSKMDKAVANGVIRAEDVLMPARLVIVDKKVIGIPFGAEIPEGTTTRQHEGLISTDAFNDLLRKGMFPFGEPYLLKDKPGSTVVSMMAVHDLSHLAGFMQNPRYMAEFKAFLRGVSDPVPEVLSQRIFDYSENYSALPKKNRRAFVRSLGPKFKSLAQADVPHVQSVLDGLTDDEILGLKKKVVQIYPQLFENLGGSVNDMGFRYSGRPDLHRGNSFVYWLFADVEDQTDPAKLRQALSRFIVGGYQSSWVSPADFWPAAKQEHLPKDSALYKYLCDSGIWEQVAVSKFCE